ncbi:MAG: glycosyltransferase family A protein [Pseudolabrys sp.]
MTDPKVSVLIPAFNAEKFIGDTLKSVFRQTWKNIEIIVVNDGSTDGTAAVVKRLARTNLTLIEQENRGQTAALNKGLKHATGDFVQYLDADDLIDPDKIEQQMARLLDNPGCIASAEWGRFYGSPEETRFDPEPVWRDLSPIDWLVISRADGQGMMFPALWLVPMPIVRAIGPWREDLTLNNDAEYFTRAILAAERVQFCAGARCRYRSGISGSLSGRKSSQHWASQIGVLQLCESYVRAKEDSDRVRRGFALSWQHIAHACHPYDPEIAEWALARARELHPETIQPDGGPAFKFISRLVGWRIARRLQIISGHS